VEIVRREDVGGKSHMERDIGEDVGIVYEYAKALNRGDLGDFYATSSTKNTLDLSENGELPRGESSNHEQTSTKTGEQTPDTKLTTHLNETSGGGLPRKRLGLVDL